jgi:hypothetical protein
VVDVLGFTLGAEFAGIDDTRLAAFPFHRARVTGLSSARCIKDGAIETDSILPGMEDSCLGALQIGVRAKQRFGGHYWFPSNSVRIETDSGAGTAFSKCNTSTCEARGENTGT